MASAVFRFKTFTLLVDCEVVFARVAPIAVHKQFFDGTDDAGLSDFEHLNSLRSAISDRHGPEELRVCPERSCGIA